MTSQREEGVRGALVVIGGFAAVAGAALLWGVGGLLLVVGLLAFSLGAFAD